ncbi:NAC transcription factor 29-like [Vicia villosa]|uniref:NAC transcription factor 29-like n=1 Tax=Vicia villosa TaxID=3911 RepID=UPI00273BF152|nr:NAC transcription factor 29-like [Vicia villosa]
MEFLPPGVGFFPSDELTVGYFLANKNNPELQAFNGCQMIPELNVYRYDPYEMLLAPSFSLEHRSHFYCFAPKVEDEITVRHCVSGFWKKIGNVRDIRVGADNVALGKKSLFVFFFGNSVHKAVKTNWIMYEYALADTPRAPFVVCRIFERPQGMDLEAEFGPFNEVDVMMNDVNPNSERDAAASRMNEGGDAAGPSNQNEKCVTLIINITLYLADATTVQLDRAIIDGDFLELADLY